MAKEQRHEISLERKMRRLPFLIPTITLLTGLALFTGILFCGYYFEQGYFWTFIPAGLMGHAFFIVIVHDGAHKSITRSKIDRYYVGVSGELEIRLERHNKGTSRSTSRGTPVWKLEYEEKYPSRSEAMKRESYLKRMKSRIYIESLIEKSERD